MQQDLQQKQQQQYQQQELHYQQQTIYKEEVNKRMPGNKTNQPKQSSETTFTNIPILRENNCYDKNQSFRQQNIQSNRSCNQKQEQNNNNSGYDEQEKHELTQQEINIETQRPFNTQQEHEQLQRSNYSRHGQVQTRISHGSRQEQDQPRTARSADRQDKFASGTDSTRSSSLEQNRTGSLSFYRRNLGHT